MTKEKLLEAMDALCRGETPEGVTVHVSHATTDADWDALNPNSLETECRDCGAYYTKEWQEGEEPPRELTCPECGSGNHGGVGSPAGGFHLMMHDPRLP
jgi:Zn finger protein HypA/HybF involved in hydrogenase expression